MRSPRRTTGILSAVLLLGALTACGNGSQQASTPTAQEPVSVNRDASGREVTIRRSVKHDESPALASITPRLVDVETEREAEQAAEADREAAADAGQASKPARTPSLGERPTRESGGDEERNPSRTHIIPHPKGNGIDSVAQRRLIGSRRTVRPDGSVATTSGSSAAVGAQAAPTTGTSFDSIGKGYSTFSVNSAPPDTNSAVGPTQIVTIVNSGFTVQSKTGSILYGPSATNTVFSGFGGACEGTNDGDGVVRYDRLADRWVITQFANVFTSSGPYYECVAVSKTADATGAYYRYAFQFANFPDYPKVSVWPDAYYVTYNMFSAAGFWLYATACAMDRSNMLLGNAATQVCYNTSSSYGALLAGDVDSATAPPTGAPNPLIALGVSNNDLAAWKFKPNFTTPSSSTFTGPTTLTISSYSMACGGGNCVPQSGTTNTLDALGDRLMNRYAYRNFGDHQSLVVSHSVNVGSTVGARWYEIRLDGSNNPSIYQQGTFTPDSTYRFMPSIAMDKAGNIALGYSTSSSTSFPSIAVTGRLDGETLGTMTQGETIVQAGGGSQTGSLHRWGDYATMNIDPSDDCTFWFSTEYLKASGSFNWSTRVSSFTLPNCLTPATDGFTMSATPSSGAVLPTQTASTTIGTVTTIGSGQTVALTATGLPTGATATFTPSSIATGSSSTLDITTGANTPGGTYTITITGTGGVTTSSTTYSLTVSSFGVTLSPTSGAVTQGSGSVASTVSVTKTGNAQSVTLSALGVPAGVTATFGSNTVNSGASTTLTLSAENTVPVGNYTITVQAVGATQTKTANYSLSVKAPVLNSIVNPGFESGTLANWTATGASNTTVATARSGSWGARSGSTLPTNGISQITQTAVAPTGATKLTFWYYNVCPANNTSRDYASATLYDATTAKTTTILAKTCTPTGSWRQVSANVTAGRTYTLTLINKDDNRSNQAGYTVWDDVIYIG